MKGQIYFLTAIILVVPNEILGHGGKKHISKQINIGLANQDSSIENEDTLNNAHQIHRDLTIVTNYDKKKKIVHGNNHSKKIIKLQPHEGSHSTHVHIQSSQFGSQESNKNIDGDLLAKLRNDRERKKALKEEKLKAIKDGIEKKKALRSEKLLAHKKAKKNIHSGVHTGEITIDISNQNSKFNSHGRDLSSDSRSDDFNSDSRSEDFISDSRGGDFSSDSRSKDSKSNLHSHHVKQESQLNSKEIKILRDYNNPKKNIGTDLLTKLKNDRERKKALKAEKLKATRDDIERKKALKAEKLKAIRGDIARKKAVRTDKLKALEDANKPNSHTGLQTGDITIDITKQNSKSDSRNGDISGSSESHEVELIPQLSSKELEILQDHIEIVNKNTNTGADWLAKLKNERERKETIKAEKLKAIRDDIERKKAIKADKLKALKEAKSNSHTGLHTGGITIEITKQNSKSDLHGGDSSGDLHSHHVQVIPQLNPKEVEILRDYNNKNKNTGADLLAKLKNERERKEALKAEKLKVILDDIERKKEAKINSQAGLHTGDLTIDISKQSDSKADVHPGGLVIDISKKSESRSDNLGRNREQDVEIEKVGGSVKKAVNSVTHVVSGGIGTLIDATVDQLKKSRERNQQLLNEVSKTESDLLKDHIPDTNIPRKTIQISHSFSHDKNLDIDSSNQQIGILKHPVLLPNKKKIDISHSFTHDKNFDIDSSSNQQIGILKHHLSNTSTKKKTLEISHSFSHDKNLGIGGSKTKTISRKFHLESHKKVV